MTPADLALPPPKEGGSDVVARVLSARGRANARNGGRTNADLPSKQLYHVAVLDRDGQSLVQKTAETLELTARGYHRVLPVARTLADVETSENVRRLHIAEAPSHRRDRKGLPSEPVICELKSLKKSVLHKN